MHNDMTCYGCQFLGHYRNQCPYQTRDAVISVHVGWLLTQGESFRIPKSWLLLDTCSTCDVSNNPNLVTDIRECAVEERLLAHTNGGEQSYGHVANLALLPIQVHFKLDSMATILSLKSVANIPSARITMDTGESTDIILTLEDGRIFRFKQYRNGLYFFDTNTVNNETNAQLSNYSLVHTVSDNKLYFSAQEIKGADASKKY